jgi:hypothetical protein
LTRHIKSSALLLVFLGVLFSIPIVTKTWSAHGAFPALASGVVVVALVFMGPISFLIANTVETASVLTTPAASGLEISLYLLAGLALFYVWLQSLRRGRGQSIPYIPVMGWAFLGAYCCILTVFTHIA